jgi:hypothetical protein
MKKIILLFIMIVISCGEKKEEVTVDSYTRAYTEEPEPIYYYDKKTDSILNKIGLEVFRDISKEDIDVILEANSNGFFDNKSFCDFYKEWKILDFQKKFDDADKLLVELKKNKKLWDFFVINGYKICPVALIEARQYSVYNKKKSNEQFENSNLNPCIVSIDFIKKDLYNPSTLDYSLYDCNKEQKSDGSYVILRKISAQNSLGVERDYIYKVRIGFLGGDEYDSNNWKLISIQSEEYK